MSTVCWNSQALFIKFFILNKLHRLHRPTYCRYLWRLAHLLTLIRTKLKCLWLTYLHWQCILLNLNGSLRSGGGEVEIESHPPLSTLFRRSEIFKFKFLIWWTCYIWLDITWIYATIMRIQQSCVYCRFRKVVEFELLNLKGMGSILWSHLFFFYYYNWT